MSRKLSNEVLPAPTVIPSKGPGGPPSVRERVLKRVQLALATGAATVALTACPVACDCLPPPAACASDGGVLGQVDATAVLDVGAPQRRFKVHLSQKAQSGLVFDPDASTTGGTVLQQNVTASDASFVIVPDAGATELVIRVGVTCNDFRTVGPMSTVIVITVSNLSSDTPSVSLADVPAPDAGFDGGDDGGTDGGGDAGLDGGSDAGSDAGTDGGDGG